MAKRSLPRRQLALAWLCGVLVGGWSPALGSGPITVLTSSGVEAYAQALEGLKAGLGPAGQDLAVVDVETAAADDLHQVLRARGGRLIVTIGGNAGNATASGPAGAPVFRTMIMSGGQADATARVPVATVALNVPPATVFAHLKEIFPGKNRLGILRSAAGSSLDANQAQAQARQSGFKVKVVDCAGPEKLLEAFLSLKGEVDFVWCLPDSTLFNATTVKPLVLASISDRLPIIGFSESFLRAGAAVGIYPDFRDIGLQTAELVKKYIQGQKVTAQEYPRKFRIGVNHRVLRLVGMRHAAPAAGNDELVIVK